MRRDKTDVFSNGRQAETNSRPVYCETPADRHPLPSAGPTGPGVRPSAGAVLLGTAVRLKRLMLSETRHDRQTSASPNLSGEKMRLLHKLFDPKSGGREEEPFRWRKSKVASVGGPIIAVLRE